MTIEPEDVASGAPHRQRPNPAAPPGEQPLGHDGAVPAELSHAGAVTDKAIDYMLGEKLPPMAIASALLGGSLGLLARTMTRPAMIRMLENAIDSVRNGELDPANDRGPGRA